MLSILSLINVLLDRRTVVGCRATRRWSASRAGSGPPPSTPTQKHPHTPNHPTQLPTHTCPPGQLPTHTCPPGYHKLSYILNTITGTVD